MEYNNKFLKRRDNTRGADQNMRVSINYSPALSFISITPICCFYPPRLLLPNGVHGNFDDKKRDNLVLSYEVSPPWSVWLGSHSVIAHHYVVPCMLGLGMIEVRSCRYFSYGFNFENSIMYKPSDFRERRTLCSLSR